MSLQAGTRLGPYEIVSALGAGGMGEVYRARDQRLGRDVAIKVLPVAFSADPERLQRFEQEARAAAALNHPNILAVYDIGHEPLRHPALDTREHHTVFIVSELLEGETLRERLSAGALPVRKVVEYGAPIARGLAAAHEKGIVHRDLKPENIFVTTDGRVKILDFGLAKLTQADPALGGASALPTTPPNTMPGLVLGTVGYMSPEQVRGLAVDHRSDIFALGAVLYEMLSGQRAFRGETAMDSMTAILKDDPPSLPAAERHIPPALARIVDRCLEKSPGSRFKSADDLAFALEALSGQSGSTDAVVSRAAPRRRGRLPWIVAAGFFAFALAAALAAPYLRAPTAAPEMRVEISTPATADPISFAISPDGRRLVFVASGDGPSRLWLRPLDAVTAQPLAGTEGASSPFWSPDNRSVAFFADSKLKRIDIGGGLPQTLANSVNMRSGAWSSDGVILFTQPGAGALSWIPASGGEAVAVTKLQAGQSSHRVPRFLPGGRQFLFYAQGTPETQGIYVGSLDAPEITRLTDADAGGGYAPPGQTSLVLRAMSRLSGASHEGGWLLFVRQGTLVARRFDLARRELTGDPVTVADPVGFDGTFNLPALSVSAAGLVVYRAGGPSRRQLTWFDQSGRTLGTLGAPDETGLAAPRLSPDGRRVAVSRVVEGNPDIWLLDSVRSTRFTFDPSADLFAVWSPDGSRIAFDSNRTGHRDLYQKRPNGAGREDLLVESPLNKAAHDWSADGRFLLYGVLNDPKTGFDEWVLPLTGDRKPFAFLNSSYTERQGAFSPDGRWVAYGSDESGRFEIYVRPFPGPSGAPSAPAAVGTSAVGTAGGQWQVSTAGGIWARWRPDGKALYYVAPDGKLMAAPIAVNGTTLEPGAPVALFQTRIVGGGTNTGIGRQYDVAADGRFLINVTIDEATASPITLLMNWNPGLTK